MKRPVEELLSRELALTLSTEGERLHAQIFKGVELHEGHAEIPVSLELVAMLDEYERGAGTDADVVARLETRIRALADSIVREMRGDRVSQKLTNLFVPRSGASALQYYVNWRAMVLKLHTLMLRVDGLDEILELHRPGSKVRKQVALAAHPARHLLRSKEAVPSAAGKNRAPPVFHQPLFHPIRATSRSAVFKASEQERKAELLRTRTEPAPPPPRQPLKNYSEPPLAFVATPAVVPAVAPSRRMSDASAVPQSASPRNSSPARPPPLAIARALADAAQEDERGELSASLPSRYESHFLGSGPIPPARLTEAIKLRAPDKGKLADGGSAAVAPVTSAIPSSAASSSSLSVSSSSATTVMAADQVVGSVPPAEAAPPFRTNSASLEQLVVVQPVGRFSQQAGDEESSAPPRSQLVDYDAASGEWEKAPDWMRFVVHWNGTSPVAGPSCDPRGVRIPLPFLLMGVQARGAYDHALLGVVCLALWKAAGSPKLTLGPYLPPGFLERNGIRMQNRALNTLEKELQLLGKGPVSESKIRSLQKHFVLPSSDKKAALAKLSSAVYAAIRANVLPSLEQYERFCIALLGCDDDASREAAVKLLNGIFDGHDWQRTEAFEPVMRSVGDSFVVEIDAASLGSTVPSQSVLLQVCMAPQTGTGPRVFFSVKPRILSSGAGGASATAGGGSRNKGGSERLLVDWLPPFSRCGFVDWRFVHLDDSGQVTPLVSPHLCSGRVIVQPKTRAECIHELSTSSLSFAGMAACLRDLQRNGVTTLYVSGASAGPSVDELTDRRLPSVSAGGSEGFAELLTEAKRVGVTVIVDIDHRVSAASHARRYSSMMAHRMDASRRFPVPMEGHDGLHMPFPKCALLNYRRKEVWDELVQDALSWCSRGADGVRLASSHCTPLILRSDATELGRVDPDGQQHYKVSEIFEGAVCLPPTNESVTFGYYGTDALYPNPLLIKIAMSAWQLHSACLLFAESYWRRAANALTAGFVPQSAELSDSLNSIFGVTVTPDLRRVALPERSSVKLLYEWFRDERATYPPNSIVVNASSHHFLPYPLLLHGPGAWATVDMLYFGPDVPSTFGGECQGDNKWWGSSHLSALPAGPGYHDIAAHYAHRARLRQTYRVLRDGGFLPLLTFWGDSQKSWHDRVFAFARFTTDKMAICAINFNDAESTVYIDLSPLAELCDQNDGSVVFKILDLIDPSSPPRFFVPSEFLADRHYYTLQPYRSLLLGLFVETMSPSTERALFEQSFRRLQDKLLRRQDASANFLFRELSSSFASLERFDACLSRLVRVLKPDLRSPFPEDMRRLLYHMTRDNKSKEALILAYLASLQTEGSAHMPTVKDWSQRILEANEIGPIVFITPEMGRFSTVGGIGVMVSELTRSLAELGLDVRVISPYYNFDKKGTTGYLEKEGIKWQQNVMTTAGNEFVECGLHTGEEMGVKLYFIHHWRYFSTPYQSGSPAEQLLALVVMAKASLELLCQLHVIPSIVVTNDWFTGLVPAYARHTGSFGSSFAGTTFFHLIHNLEEGYEGKMYVDGNDDLGHIHQMRREHIVESFDGRVTVLNASKCALLACNQWGTVSRSYRDDLLRVSPLRYLLCQFEAPFAHLNGIRTADRLEVLRKGGAADHAEAKKRVQEKYFGRSDPSVALFAFVGRVVLQKGVHLILECARAVLSTHGSNMQQVQILVGGPANKKDPYAASCAWKMAALCSEYPKSFWADPDQFFMDGTLVNAGADFALVPSLFEPSGIVQQEFFSGGTPVLAFKTGGLKDTVFEYDPTTGNGNGLTFESHQFDDLMAAMQRALRVFRQPEHYAKLRSNARKSVLDNTVVADAWSREFCRLKERLWCQPVVAAHQENSNTHDGVADASNSK